MQEEYWTKRDGTKIAVGDMDIEHLRNTLRMLIRKANAARILISTKYGLDEDDTYGNEQDISTM